MSSILPGILRTPQLFPPPLSRGRMIPRLISHAKMSPDRACRAGYAGNKGETAVNYATDFKSIRNDVSEPEWQARLDLAACYRLVDAYGMSDLIYNHITTR